MSAETQWLAPDNYQDDPSPVVAQRTSPTNIGLQMLGIVSAYDLGFLSCGAMIERLELVFRSLEGMERFRGHFYNWYELSGNPADPRSHAYIPGRSTAATSRAI